MSFDLDTLNEDWIKTRTWDLPTEPEWIIPRLASLKALPCWLAAPPEVLAIAAEVERPQRKRHPILDALRAERDEIKGDRPGHAFRGNQHVRVGGGTERGRKLMAALKREPLPVTNDYGWPDEQATIARASETLAALREIEGGDALIDAVNEWKVASWNVDPIQEAAQTLANGGTPADAEMAGYARSLLTAISDMPSTSPELLRGLSIQSDTTHQADLLADMVEKFKVGETVDLGLSSFTTDAKTAELFGEAAGGVSVILKTKGAKALPVESMMDTPPMVREREWITAGRFKVEQVEQVESWIEYDGGRVEMVPRLNVTVSQVAVPKIEGQA